jgi:hypothetical protein
VLCCGYLVGTQDTARQALRVTGLPSPCPRHDLTWPPMARPMARPMEVRFRVAVGCGRDDAAG